MRYRIQVTVSGDRLAAVIDAAFRDAEFDPELKVYPHAEMDAQVHAVPAPQKTAIPPPPKRRARMPVGREEAIEHALESGPKRWSELRAVILKADLPQWALNSVITRWQSAGKIRRTEDGLWSLVGHAQG